MAVIILAALAGFFGSGGPMARMAVTDGDRMVSLERMEQIKYAVMEVGGGISVIPK